MCRMLTAITMAAVLLAGCGGGTEGGSGTGSDAGSGSASDASDTRTTVRIFRKGSTPGNTDEKQLQKVEDAINDHIKDTINVKVKLTEIPTGYEEAVNLGLANKEVDLFWTASWETTIGTNDLYKNKAVYDITDLLPDSALWNSMPADFWSASTYDGRHYYIPVYKDSAEGYDLMVRGELVDKHGWDLSTIHKLEDIEPMLADCLADGLRYPFLTLKSPLFSRFNIDKYDLITADATSNWVSVDRATNELVDTIQTKDYSNFCKLMGRWGELGYVSEDEVTKTTNDNIQQTQDWGFSWWTDLPINEEVNTRYNQDVRVIPITNRYVHSTSTLGSCYAIAGSCSPEVARACVDFMGQLYTDPFVADTFTYGIEGEDYEYDDNGLIIQHSSKYIHAMWESASATAVTPMYNEPVNKAEIYEEFNNGAEVSCAAGFRYDKTPVEAQYAACQNVYEEYGFALENGGFAPAEVDGLIEEYQAALDEAGYQDVLTEFTRQYEDWKDR